MSLLSDKEILRLCGRDHMVHGLNGPMIEPMPDLKQINRGYVTINGEVEEFPIMSWGTDSYGYDARLAPDLEIFTNINNGEIFDPKRPNEASRIPAKIYIEGHSRFAILPPNSFMLGHTLEYFRIHPKTEALVFGKSTYARAGIIINPTVLKAGWEGQVVLEISNSTTVPVRIYVEEGICHFKFIKGNEPCEMDYVARSGRYQGQTGVTVGRS